MERYKQTVGTIKNPVTNKLRYESLHLPLFENRTSDIYIVAKKMERMDLIAYDWYGDPRLWWVIQRANNLPCGSLRIEPGKRVRIPWPLSVDTVDTKLTEAQF
jgi:hypothetical protein